MMVGVCAMSISIFPELNFRIILKNDQLQNELNLRQKSIRSHTAVIPQSCQFIFLVHFFRGTHPASYEGGTRCGRK